MLLFQILNFQATYLYMQSLMSKLETFTISFFYLYIDRRDYLIAYIYIIIIIIL